MWTCLFLFSFSWNYFFFHSVIQNFVSMMFLLFVTKALHLFNKMWSNMFLFFFNFIKSKISTRKSFTKWLLRVLFVHYLKMQFLTLAEVNAAPLIFFFISFFKGKMVIYLDFAFNLILMRLFQLDNYILHVEFLNSKYSGYVHWDFLDITVPCGDIRTFFCLKLTCKAYIFSYI